MSLKKCLILFSVLACAKAQETNELCPCDTESDKDDTKNVWDFLKKMSDDISKESEALYAVAPGSLYQFDCSRCDEKLRKKRKIMLEDEVDTPEEIPEIKDLEHDDDTGARKTDYHTKDYRCPEGRIFFLHTCVPKHQFDNIDESEEE